MNIIKKFATGSSCYKAGRKITVKGLMLHSVGCNQPSALVFANRWNYSTDVCCHAVLEADGDIYQTLPWNHRAWHCGRSGNNTHIAVEMTEPSQIRYTGGASFTCSDKEAALAQVKGTYDTAVELFAYLCREYGLNPLKDICSHAEGNRLGIASNHGDPEHLWKGLKTGYTMDGFRAAVKAKMNESSESRMLYRVRKAWGDKDSQIGAFYSIDNAKAACLSGYSVFDADGKAVYEKTTVQPLKGDVNGDGKLTAADAREALRAVAGLETLTEEQETRADWNGDGKVTASDARGILREAAGLETNTDEKGKA